MSEMETVKGKIVRIDVPQGLSVREEVEYLINQGYKFDEEELEMDFYLSDEVMHIDKKWYEILEKKELDSFGFLEHKQSSDGTIEFIASWYNGGGSLEEVLEEAVK